MHRFVAVAAFAVFGVASVASAADMPVKAPPSAAPASTGLYWELDGAYVLADPNLGFVNGFGAPIQGHGVGPGDGVWVSGHVGYVMPSGWDWRLGGGYAKLRAGDTNGVTPNNAILITGAHMYNVDADVGFTFGRPVQIRPFIGVRYLNWNEKADIPASIPVACCFLNSDYNGAGPLVGFDLKAPISFLQNVSLVAGADVAALFGDVDYQRGSFANPTANGSMSRTAWNYGAYAGFDWRVMQNISLGIKYRYMAVHGASFENPQLLSGTPPSGSPTNILQGPSVSLAVKY